MTTTLDKNAIETIVEIARQAVPTVLEVSSLVDDPGLPEKIAVYANPITGDVTSLQGAFEKYRTTPDRKRGTAVTTDLDSFIKLTVRHKTADSAIFASTDWRAPAIQAVIDYHKEHGGYADNLDHRIRYEFPLSTEWKKWVEVHGQPLSQREFAEWIEDNIQDFGDAEKKDIDDLGVKLGYQFGKPSDLIRFSRGISVDETSQISENIKLSQGTGGVSIVSALKGADGKQLEIPELFILSIPTFDLGGETRIPVRLRYRKTPQGSSWSFLLYRPDNHIQSQVQTTLKKVETDTKLPVFSGKPESF